MMEGAIDVRLLITLGGILFSVAGAAAAMKASVKQITATLEDLESRLRAFDRRLDQLEVRAETTQGRLTILSNMSSPENLRRDHMAMASLTSTVEQLRKDTDHLIHIHNSRHIPVANVRHAE